jgi:hypothetical protein
MGVESQSRRGIKIQFFSTILSRSQNFIGPSRSSDRIAEVEHPTWNVVGSTELSVFETQEKAD